MPTTKQPRLLPDAKSTRSSADALAHLNRPLTKQDIDTVRDIEGFPIGTDEDIITLSDPPYYTACPNPFLQDFVRAHSEPYTETNDSYECPPFTGDVLASERHSVYSAHPYHTKVPPDIIATLLGHYCKPGFLVLDVFCGTGMTGVAAREANLNSVLVDLSPIATFIAGVNCQSLPYAKALARLEDILRETEAELGYVYETRDRRGRQGLANHYVWCDVFTCPNCDFEFPFFPFGVIHHKGKVETRDTFQCPNCSVDLNVRQINRVITFDGWKKKRLVWVNAKVGKETQDRQPTDFDLELAARVENQLPKYWYPTEPVDPQWYSARLAQLDQKHITSIDRFLSRRNLLVYSSLFERVRNISDPESRLLCAYALTGVFTVISERQGYFGGGGGMSGNLYMPIVRMEKNVFQCLRRRVSKLRAAEVSKERLTSRAIVSTQSATSLKSVPDNSIDYIYTDPPFGANIIYSEMNIILEGWLKVVTNNKQEAVINDFQSKSATEYSDLMNASFAELFRVLKPGRWITVEFHNTQASIWNIIQEGLGRAGFVVAQTGTLDKGSSTILQDIRPGAVNNDIIISAYKPRSAFENRFSEKAGTTDGAWDFVRQHLKHLPIFVGKNEVVQVVAERQDYLLFDRMVAFHIQRGVSVPLNAAEFYSGLRQRYPERDSMYFTPEQVAEYDAKRAQAVRVEQLSLFVSDEKSAVQWLRTQLEQEPHTYQDIQPKFLRELHQARHEQLPELSRLLEENFLKDEEDRWYVPDPRRSEDLEKLRERGLLREFEAYVAAKGRLKTFRTEAVRAGFKAAWGRRDYKTIVDLARRLPEDVLQEDSALLMYYDNALTRSGG